MYVVKQMVADGLYKTEQEALDTLDYLHRMYWQEKTKKAEAKKRKAKKAKVLNPQK